MSPKDFLFPTRQRRAVFWNIITWGGITLVGLLNLLPDLGRPFPSFLVSRQADGGDRWFFDINTPSWWLNGTEGEQLASGMELLALNGQPYDINHPARFASLTPGTLVTITAQTATGPRDFRVPVRVFTWGDLLDFRLPNLVMMVALFLLAWAVYAAQPHNMLNNIAATTFVLVGAVRALHQGVVFPVNEALDVMLDTLVNSVAFNFIGPLCLWLVLVFPEPNRWADWLGPYLNAFAWLVLAVPRVAARLWVFFFGSTPVTLFITDVTIAISMGLCLIAMLAALWRWGALSFERAPHTRLRWQVRPAMFTVWLGMVVSVAPVLISILSPYTALLPLSYFVYYFDLRYLMLGLPLAMSYVILRHHTLTGHQGFATLALSLMLASVVAAFAANTLYLNQASYGMVLPRPPFEGAFLLVFGSMLVAHQFSTRSLGRLFNRDAAHLADVSALSQRLMLQLSQADLPATIPGTLINDLHFARAALWLRAPNDLAAPFTLRAHAGSLLGSLPPTLLAAPPQTAPLWVLVEPDLPAALRPLQAHPGWDVALALRAEGQTLGWLAVGRHPDDVFLVPYDRNLLYVLAQNIALALWANHTLLELRQTPRRLAEVQDRERLRLAQDLHDSIQQFLGRLPFQLEISRNLVHTDPARASAVLARCLEDVEHAARTVRQIRHDLVPLGLERAFALTLTELVGRFQAEHQITVHLHMDADLEHGLPLDVRKAIYWVVKQALDNVAAHAAASTVHVRCTRNPERVLVEIGDDGRGFGPAERESARARDRFGLQVMHGRFALLGGQLTVDSQPGQGTWVRGWLPM